MTTEAHICAHGSLRRQCQICLRDADVERLETQVAILVGVLEKIIERANNDPLGTSKVRDMEALARAALYPHQRIK